MVISHNLSATYTSNKAKRTNNARSKSSMKLSSGYKINSSADDAAGLKISQKLRWQIRGLNKATQNISDAISVANIADGALSGISSIIQRQRELLVQGANDTNTTTDRTAIQSEIDQLTEEADRIFTTTAFNNRQLFVAPDIVTNRYNFHNTDRVDYDHIPTVNPAPGSSSVHSTLYTSRESALPTDEYGRSAYRQTDSRIDTTRTTVLAPSETYSYDNIDTTGTVTEYMPQYIMIQSGALEKSCIAMRLYDMSSSSLYLDTFSVNNYHQATSSISNADEALRRVNSIRSYYGGISNRLNYAMSIDQYTSENLDATDSKLTDTDISKESLNQSKLSILSQAQNSILAQQNKASEWILKLLQ